MTLIDRSPGAFITASFAFVYTMICVEIAMIVEGGAVMLVLTLSIIAALSAVLCRAMFHLIGSEADSYGLEAPAVVETTPVVRVRYSKEMSDSFAQRGSGAFS